MLAQAAVRRLAGDGARAAWHEAGCLGWHYWWVAGGLGVAWLDAVALG